MYHSMSQVVLRGATVLSDVCGVSDAPVASRILVTQTIA